MNSNDIFECHNSMCINNNNTRWCCFEDKKLKSYGIDDIGLYKEMYIDNHWHRKYFECFPVIELDMISFLRKNNENNKSKERQESGTSAMLIKNPINYITKRICTGLKLNTPKKVTDGLDI